MYFNLLQLTFVFFIFLIMEVAGVEPASKQGTRKLSTRLAAV